MIIPERKTRLDKQRRSGGEWALQEAIKNQDLAGLERIIDDGINLNKRFSWTPAGGKYPLEYAVTFPEGIEIVKMLLKRGADAKIIDNIISAAVICDSTEMLSILLDAGADINGAVDTALNTASLHGMEEMMEFLMIRGADVNEKSLQDAIRSRQHNRIRMMMRLIQHGADVNAIGDMGTPLTVAASLGDLEAVVFLLEKGSDINLVGGRHHSPLHAICATPRHLWQHAKIHHDTRQNILQILIREGGDPNILGGRYGSALQAAVMLRNEEAAGLLLPLSTAVISRSTAMFHHEGTILHSAVSFSTPKLLRDILDAGAYVHISTKDSLGRTPLHWAMEKPSIVELDILEPWIRAEDYNDQDSEGATPLNIAAKKDNLEACSWLLDHAARIDIPDFSGQTPLHVAIANESSGLVRLLVPQCIRNMDDVKASDCRRALGMEKRGACLLLTAGEKTIFSAWLPGLEETDADQHQQLYDLLTDGTHQRWYWNGARLQELFKNALLSKHIM